jgi:hypothetical protein
MADNQKLAMELWWRYQYLRDHGHLKFIEKAAKCDKFFAGIQWDQEALDTLKAQNRPALTINKILSTIANITGEQIFNRTEIGFRPNKKGATEATAEALTKVFKQIGDANQLTWTRTDVYLDGLIGSRGFYDMRLDFSDSLQGDARIEQLNPKNVLIDSDASHYDPDKWNDVITTKWLSIDDVELVYGKKWRKKLEGNATMMSPYEYDMQDWDQDKFGDPHGMTQQHNAFMDQGTQPLMRVVRVLERQWKKLDKREHFVHLPTGEIRPIPDGWEREDIGFYLQKNQDYSTVEKLAPRIRWTVGAGMEILHDEWSPYNHFTVVPFFPYFRRGTTIGVVENLLGPQELLNKVSSQELHVINTTANSGWKLKAGSLQNMSIAELESRGATTGVVLELDEVTDAEKILPNQVPSGLDRVSFKAEEHIKTISGLPDANTGFAREDVSAKALKANQVTSSANFAMVQDNLNRTDFFLARGLLDIVQQFYTEERMLHITTDPLERETEEFKVNEVTPEGEILNDLTIGEYDIVVTNQPERDTLEDSTFAQAAEMRKELGVAIPDDVLIKSSRLPNKIEVVEAINSEKNSEEAQLDAKIERERAMAEVRQINSGSKRDDADSVVKQVKAQQDAYNLTQPIPPEAQLRVEAELAKSRYQVDSDAQIKREQIISNEKIAMLKIKSAEKTAATAAKAAAAAPKPAAAKPAAKKPAAKKAAPKK